MPNVKRIMIFIDGGYLRKGIEESGFRPVWANDRFCQETIKRLIQDRMPQFGELIRTYFYDANFDPDDIRGMSKLESKYALNKELFTKLDRLPRHEVKLGYLAPSDPPRQKGVDGIMALDMLIKGLDNHYDVAIVVCGDRDFHPIIKTVKDRTGRNILGVIFSATRVSEDLIKEFDDVLMIVPENNELISRLGFKTK